MPEFSLSFEVYCSCGEGLCNQTTTRMSRLRGEPQAVVEPCQKCLQAARDEAAEARAKEVREELNEQIEELSRRLYQYE